MSNGLKGKEYTIVQAAAETGYTKTCVRNKLEELVAQGLARKRKETVNVSGGKSVYYTFRPATKTHSVYTLAPGVVLPKKTT